ncbi:MAG: SDR family oxidoreductase, partial [Acidobacteria bacterium]|nr:SDR family oxidoreductase [Acidobacteriota bacterium]
TSVAVCPSYVRTPVMEKQIDHQSAHHGIPESEVIEKIMFAPAPQKRLLEPSEVAEFILFLTSDAAQGITGSAVAIDCGWTSQ